MPADHSESGDADIRMAYHSIAQNGTLNWLLLSYGKWAGGLRLFAAGSRGISELKRHITDENIYFAFCRESVDETHYYVTIAYIPEGVSGLRRTRAISTSRTVQSWFKVTQAMLTITRLEDLTSDTVIKSIRVNELPPVPMFADSIARTTSEFYNTQKSLPLAPVAEDSFRRSQSVGESHNLPPQRYRSPVRDFGNPAERAKRRQETQRRQEIEDEIAAREEALRQARIKREKEEVIRKHEEEERRRRESLEQDLRRAASLKAEKEEEERAASELRVIERELKKRVDAEKRLNEARRIEASRREEQRRLDELERLEEEARRQIEDVKQMSRTTALQLRKARLSGGDHIIHRGWVTMQNANSLVWRRRWFELTETSMKLYKNDKDLSKVLDTVELTGRIAGVKEWSDGFEELRAMPHSFAVVFSGSQESLSAYTDSSREKADLAGFLLTYV